MNTKKYVVQRITQGRWRVFIEYPGEGVSTLTLGWYKLRCGAVNAARMVAGREFPVEVRK